MAIQKALFAGDERSSGDMPTPSEIQRRRALAEQLLASGGQTENISHPLQLASSLLQSGVGAWNLAKANRDEKAGREFRNEALLDAYDRSGFSSFSGSAGPASSSPTSAGGPRAAASIPSGERAGYIRQGLISRGLPEHVADGFLVNFQDESGLDPGINEANPIVPGSRGGFGLFQSTGPRRRALESVAAMRRVDPSDIDTQLDVLTAEMGLPGTGLEDQPWFGSESRAAQSILGSRDVSSAAQSIVSDFLRPSPEHRASRSQRYAGLTNNLQGIQTPSPSLQQEAEALQPQIQGTQVASLDPSIGMSGGSRDALVAALGAPAPNVSPANQALGAALTGGGASPSTMQPQTPQSSPAPDMGQRDAMVAQLTGGQTPQPTQGVSRETIAQLLSNEWTEDIGQSLLMQQIEAQRQANDPLRQIQLQKAQFELQQLQNPRSEYGFANVGGNLFRTDPRTGTADILHQAPAESGTPDAFQALQLRAQAAGFQPGTPEYQSFMASGGRSESSSEAEERISRMSENLMQTGDFIDPQEARNVAVGIVDGRLRADRHPITGEMQIVDMATGAPAYPPRGGAQGSQPSPPQSETLAAPSTPMTAADRFGAQYQSGPQAFGLEGAARRVLNMAGDASGFGAPYPETQAAQADYSVLQESVLNDIASSYGRQPPSWLLQEIRNLTPTPGSPFEGPGSAASKLNAIGRHLTNELQVTEQALARNLSPTQRQEMEARQAGLYSAINRVDGAIASFGERPQEQGQGAPDAEGWTTLPGGVRIREIGQ